MNPFRASVLAGTLLLAAHPLLAQFVQQGPRLNPVGATTGAEFGTSVSLSADGNTALIGSPRDQVGVGAAWIFTRSGAVWTQQAKLIGGSGMRGRSVALSADGDTALVGGFFDALVFTRSGDVWTQQGGALIGADGPFQVRSVSLSADGDTALLGSSFDGGGTGAAWIFVRNAGVWTQQGSKLVGPAITSVVAPSQQGFSVSLSADGNTAAVGGYGDGDYDGAVWIWGRNAGIWTLQTKLPGTSGSGEGLGFSVAISDDGDTLTAGAPYGTMGRSRVFVRDGGGGWTEQAVLTGSGAVGVSFQGASVALSADGNLALVGGSSDASTGATWVFARTGTTWMQQGNKLVGSDSTDGQSQGAAGSLSDDGATAIVGGPFDSRGTGGAVWVFVADSHLGAPAVPALDPAGVVFLALALGIAGVLVRWR